MSKYIDFFEKNTINVENQDVLIDLMSDSVHTIRKYLDLKSLQYDKKKDFLDSEEVQKIWLFYSSSVKDGQVDSSYFKTKKGQFLTTYYKDKQPLFTFEEFVYLAFNVEYKGNPLTFEIEKYALSEEKNMLTLNVAPIVLDIYLPVGLMYKLSRNFIFKRPKEMSYFDYFLKNYGMLSTLLENNRKKSEVYDDLVKYFEQGGKIYDLNDLFQYSDTPMGYEYDSYKTNKMSSKIIILTFAEIILNKGFDFILSFEKDLDDNDAELNYLILKEMFIKKIKKEKKNHPLFFIHNSELIRKRYVEMNNLDLKYKLSSTDIDDSVLKILFDSLNTGEIKTIYFPNEHLINLLSVDSIILLQSNKDKITLKDVNNFDKLIEKRMKERGTLNPKNMKEMMTESMLNELYSLFGSVLSNYKYEEELNAIEICNVIEENKDLIFNFEDKKIREGESFIIISAYSSFKDNGFDLLIDKIYSN